MRAPSVEVLEDRAYLSGIGAVWEADRPGDSARGRGIALVAESFAIKLRVSVGTVAVSGLRVETAGLVDVDLGAGPLGVSADVGLSTGPVGVSLGVAADLDAGLAHTPLGVSADVGLSTGSVGVSLGVQVGGNLGDGDGNPGGSDPGPGSDPGGSDPGPGNDPGGVGSSPGRDPGEVDAGPGRDPGEADAVTGHDPQGASPGAARDLGGVDAGSDNDAGGMAVGPVWIGIDHGHGRLLESQAFEPRDHRQVPVWAGDSLAMLDRPVGSEEPEANREGSEARGGNEASEVATRGQDGRPEVPGPTRATSSDDLADYPAFSSAVFEALVRQLHHLLGDFGTGAAGWFPPVNWGFAVLSVPLIGVFVANRLARWARGNEVGDGEEGDEGSTRPWGLGPARPFPHYPYE